MRGAGYSKSGYTGGYQLVVEFDANQEPPRGQLLRRICGVWKGIGEGISGSREQNGTGQLCGHRRQLARFAVPDWCALK